MKRTMILAAAAAALFALSAPGPAKASIANPSLNQIAPANPLVQETHYRHYRHSHRYRGHRYGYRSHRYRHCWTHRYRVRTHYGWRWRTVRRCGWR